jgi:hypothetical protein
MLVSQDSVKENPSHYIEKTVFMRRGLLPESAPTIAIHWCAEVPRITLFREKFTSTFNWITARAKEHGRGEYKRL